MNKIEIKSLKKLIKDIKKFYYSKLMPKTNKKDNTTK